MDTANPVWKKMKRKYEKKWKESISKHHVSKVVMQY